MTHYVLLKLAEGTNVDFVESKVRKVYEELAEELDYLHDPVTYRCCCLLYTSIVSASLQHICSSPFRIWLL